MKTKAKRKQRTKRSASDRIDASISKRMLENALKRPGVRELAEIHENTRRYEQAYSEYRSALYEEHEEWISSTSVPC